MPDKRVSLNIRIISYFTRVYENESLLIRQKSRVLVILHGILLLLSLLYTSTMITLNISLMDVLIVSAIILLLLANLVFLKKGNYNLSVLILLLIIFSGLTILGYSGEDRSHLKLYTLGFLYLFTLFVSGLVGNKSYYSILLGIAALFSVSYYFFFLSIPASSYPFIDIVDAYIGVITIIILSIWTSALLNNRLNKAFFEIMELNTGLEQKVKDRTRLLEESREQLVESEKLAALGGLVGGMSHELNTPLGNTVTAYSHLKEMTNEVRTKLEHNSLSKKDLSNFLKTADSATFLVEKNLNIATMLLNNFKKTSVDIHLQDEREITLYADIKTIVFSNTSGNPDLKEIDIIIKGSKELKILGISTILWQVLTNLLTNALHHAFPDKSGKIAIDFKERNGGIEFSVSDNGIGMNKETQKQMYEPFFTTKRGQGGTGLGLNIVYNIIRKAGGTIQCNSEIGKGTIFTFWFPWKVII